LKITKSSQDGRYLIEAREGDIPEDAREEEVGVNRLMSEEVGSRVLNHDVERTQESLRFGHELTAVAAPPVDAIPPELPFLVPDQHSPHCNIAYGLDVERIKKPKSLVFHLVFQIAEHDFVQPAKGVREEASVGEVPVKVARDILTVRARFKNGGSLMNEQGHLVGPAIGEAQDFTPIPGRDRLTRVRKTKRAEQLLDGDTKRTVGKAEDSEVHGTGCHEGRALAMNRRRICGGVQMVAIRPREFDRGMSGRVENGVEEAAPEARGGPDRTDCR